MSLLAEKGLGGAAGWAPSLLPRTLLAPVTATGTSLDAVLWLGVLILIACLLGWGVWRVGNPAKAGVCVLGLLVVLLPWNVGMAVDICSRIMVPTVLILFASSTIKPPGGALGAGLLLACLSGLITFRSFAFVENAQEEGRTVQAFRSAITAIPEGATLMVGSDRWRQSDCTRASTPFLPLGPHSHLAAYATIDRGAWEPLIFAGKGMQPLRSAKPFEMGALPAVLPPSLEALAHPGKDDRLTMPSGWPDHYDYLLILDHGCHANPIPALLQPNAEGPGFTLLKVLKQTG